MSSNSIHFFKTSKDGGKNIVIIFIFIFIIIIVII